MTDNATCYSCQTDHCVTSRSCLMSHVIQLVAATSMGLGNRVASPFYTTGSVAESGFLVNSDTLAPD